jgi:hypothetical protein
VRPESDNRWQRETLDVNDLKGLRVLKDLRDLKDQRPDLKIRLREIYGFGG